MAVEASPRPVYHSPSSLPRGRQRRASSRKSFTTSALPQSIQTPRTLCPKDVGAFAFDKKFLPAWDAPSDLWKNLPADLKKTLEAVQQAGAAVDTGFERLEGHGADSEHGSKLQTPECMTPLDDGMPNLPAASLSFPPKLRTESTSSSRFESAVGSPVFTSSQGSESPMSCFSGSQTMSPVSPMCLTPADVQFPRKRIERERSFSTPLEPQDAHYALELSQLRTESMPRLRHAAVAVDRDLAMFKKSKDLISPENKELTSADVNAFENWWAQKKCDIHELDEKVKRLSEEIGLTSTGMGWTAP